MIQIQVQITEKDNQLVFDVDEFLRKGFLETEKNASLIIQGYLKEGIDKITNIIEHDE